jgi:hypothetical protein
MTLTVAEQVDQKIGAHVPAGWLHPPAPALNHELSSPTISGLVAALAKAQPEFGAVVKSKTANVKHKDGGGSHSYKYATLDAVIDAVGPALSKVGIAFVQPVQMQERGVLVRTILMLGEEWIADSGVFMPGGSTPQASGSAITYARRYGLTALLGIAQEDDDGAAAQKEAERPRAKAKAAPKAPPANLAPVAARDKMQARIVALPEPIGAQVRKTLSDAGIVWTQLSVEQLVEVGVWVTDAETVAEAEAQA